MKSGGGRSGFQKGLKWVPLVFAAFEVGSPMGSQWVASGFPWFFQHVKQVPSGFEVGSLGFCSI